jgi:tetraacyldisaccharide 4'-kinase
LRKEIERLAPGKPSVESVHAAKQLVQCVHGEQAAADEEGLTQAPLSVLQEQPVAGFCGIGNPAAFRGSLERLQAKLVSWRTYPDHQPYSRQDVEELRAWAAQLPADAVVVTTQKDLVKLRLAELKGRPLWALQIALQITAGQDVLDRLLKGVLQ